MSTTTVNKIGYLNYRGRKPMEKKAGRFFNVLAQTILILTLIAVMLLWGGRHPTAIAALGIGTLSATVAWGLSLALRGRWVWRQAGGWWLFALALILGLLQLSPDFSALLMSDELRGAYAAAAATGLTTEVPVLAVIPSLHKEMLLLLTAAGLWYIVARQVFDTDRRALVRLALGLMGAALVAGIVGILQRFSGLEWLGPVWIEPSNSVAGTWFNKNHFAQFEAMGLFLALGILTSFTRVEKGSMVSLHWPCYARRVIAVFAGVTAVVCAMGILFSLSRTATFLAGIALLAYLFYVVRYRFQAVLGPVAIGFFLIGFVVVVGGDYALSRLEFGLSGEDSSGLVRYQLWATALSVIGLAPWTGTGFAAIRGLSSHFDTSYMPGFVTFDAHNDFLDLAAIFGIPFAVLAIVWMLFFFVRAGIRIMKKEGRHSSLHAIAVGAWLALFCALGHEFMDYGLKQGANLVMALGLLIVMTGLSRRLTQAPGLESSRHGHYSTVAEKEGARMGRAFYVFPGVVAALVAGVLPVYTTTGKTGLLTADMDDMTQVPSMRAAFNNAKWLSAIGRRAEKVKKADDDNLHALEVEGLAALRYGNARESDAMASSMARILDRSVSTNQVWREVYRPYREEAFMTTTEEERKAVVMEYDRAIEAFSRAYALNPLDGLLLSRLAKAEDDASAWKRDFATALPYHETALDLYPANVEVKRNAIDGFWRAWQETDNEDDKKRYEESLISLAKDFGIQVPYRLREIYPLLWSVKPSVSLLEELTPDNISALEELGYFFSKRGESEAAAKAYRKVILVNAERADEETPETIGDLEFLRRDRRSKITVERMTNERLLTVYESMQAEQEARETRERVALLLREERTPEIKKIDRAIADSDFVLAEALIKPIADDIRAKLRMADILVASGRYEGLRHWVADIKKLDEVRPMTEEEKEKFAEILSQMKRLAIDIPDAHDFDLPEDDPEPQH